MFNVLYWEACLDENDGTIKIICIKKKKFIMRGQKSKYIEHIRKSERESVYVLFKKRESVYVCKC